LVPYTSLFGSCPLRWARSTAASAGSPSRPEPIGSSSALRRARPYPASSSQRWAHWRLHSSRSRSGGRIDGPAAPPDPRTSSEPTEEVVGDPLRCRSGPEMVVEERSPTRDVVDGRLLEG